MNQRCTAHRSPGVVLALLLALLLAACGRADAADEAASPIAQPTTRASAQSGENQTASLSVQPDRGYGGLYVQVRGEKWPQNMMVLVTLEDAQGRSETLAASDTDQAGNLNTGFLFPIDQRWLEAEELSIVSTTADGRVESKTTFVIVPPGTEVAVAPDETDTGDTATSDTGTSDIGTSDPANDDPVKDSETASDKEASDKETDDKEAAGENAEEEAGHTVALPFITSIGPEVRGSNHAARASSSNRSNRNNSSSPTSVEVAIQAGRGKKIDCRNGNQWITVAIYSSGGFDATQVDPGSVKLVSGGGDLSLSGTGSIVPVAFPMAFTARDRAANRQAYQWRWRLEDADGDGSIDMVMEFRLDYLGLECNAPVVTVSGRTNDGQRFEGIKNVAMVVLERG